jgi:hypothetical protein
MIKAIGVTTRKNKSANTIGFTTFAIMALSFDQILLSTDRREGAKIPNNNSTVPTANIKHATGSSAPAANPFAAPITIKIEPTVQPNARSLPAPTGSSSRKFSCSEKFWLTRLLLRLGPFRYLDENSSYYTPFSVFLASMTIFSIGVPLLGEIGIAQPCPGN